MIENLLAIDALEAQHSVIGSMLIDSSCVGLVVSKLTENDFTDTACRNAFAAAKRLYATGKPVDRITLQDAVGGGAEWAKWAKELEYITPTSANVAAYADIVSEQASFFAMRAKAQELLDTAVNLESASKLVKSMSGLMVSSNQVHTWTAAELAKDFIKRLTSKDPPEYLKWGIPKADKRTKASLGDFIILAGYASAGKTLLSIQMALTQAKKYRVGYYTLETQPEKMADRLFAYLAGLSLSGIKDHTLRPQEIELAKKAADIFVSHTPIEFTQAANWTVEDIAAHAVSRGYQIIYIDYLQLIRGEGSTEEARLSKISTGLKLFGQATKTTVVSLAQLHRSNEKDKSGKKIEPDMHSIRGSGQIEQDADVIFIVFKKNLEDNTSERIFKVAKNKDGPLARAELQFNGATMTMTEIVEDPSREVAKHYQAIGRQVKQQNLRQRDEQVTFTELTGNDPSNPFNK